MFVLEFVHFEAILPPDVPSVRKNFDLIVAPADEKLQSVSPQLA